MSQPHVHSATAHNQASHDFKRKQHAALAGAALNLPLAVAKILAGYLGASQALIADGIDSSLDILCDALIFGAVRVGHRRADLDHPYGHARIETAATILVSLLLLITAAIVADRGIVSLLDTETGHSPTWWALAVAALSVVLKEGMYRYTVRVGRRARSKLIQSNAWHHRSDALTSAVALVAIGGAMAGYVTLDAVGAIIIAVVIASVGLRYGWQSFRELVDTGLDPERLAVVREQITSVPGVHHMRRLRTRTMGGHDAFADVGVFVDPRISLTEAHRISEAITSRLVDNVEEIADICVHIEPDGHADSTSAHRLPLREEVMPQLEAAWQHIPAAAGIQRVNLHYLDNLIAVEVLLPVDQAGEFETLQREFSAVAETVAAVSNIRVLFG